VTLGATVVEKHFTLTRLGYGSDAKHSIEPPQLRDLAEGIRAIDVMQATTVDKDDVARFAAMKTIFQKSIVARVPIRAGDVLRRDMLAFKKPGTGLPPGRVAEVVGRRARRDLPADSLLGEGDFQ
jgi:N-acetylneuraminate synthase